MHLFLSNLLASGEKWENILVFVNYMLGFVIIIYGVINLIIPLRIRIISIPLTCLFVFSTLLNIIILGWPHSGDDYNRIQVALIPDMLNYFFHFR
ncbi:hypothetical protein JTY60_01950 [symbiont of Argiope bruennichi]|uniref:hypothetical protein n=1 Tax=symbiont of Argiope bruennichi TaxID=2810479 RepID=UPI003DA592AD